MTYLFPLLARLWDHWFLLMGVLLMVEPLLDYWWEGFDEWATRFVSRKTRTRVAVTLSTAALVASLMWAFADEYSEHQKDLADLHQSQIDLAASQKAFNGLDKAVNGRGGYLDQIAALEGQKREPQTTVQSAASPVPMPHAAISISSFKVYASDQANIVAADFILSNDGGAGGDNPARTFGFEATDTPLSEAEASKRTQQAVDAATRSFDPKIIRSQIPAGSKDKFFSELWALKTPEDANDVLQRKKLVYVFMGLSFRDANLPPGQFWVTRVCQAIQLNGIIEQCDGNGTVSLVRR